jgi:hypothetical protein
LLSVSLRVGLGLPLVLSAEPARVSLLELPATGVVVFRLAGGCCLRVVSVGGGVAAEVDAGGEESVSVGFGGGVGVLVTLLPGPVRI